MFKRCAPSLMRTSPLRHFFKEKIPTFDNQHITMSFGIVDINEFSKVSAEILIEEAGRNKIIS